VKQGSTKLLCDLLICSDPRIVAVCLEGLEGILKVEGILAVLDQEKEEITEGCLKGPMKEAFTLSNISHPSHFLFFLIFSISLYLFVETPTFFFKTVKEKTENGFLECYMCCTMRPPLWARKAAIEQDKLLKGGSDEILSLEGIGSGGFVHVNITTTVFFIVIALCSQAMLYKLLSTWFIKLWVVLFCIGGMEGQQPSWIALLSCCRPHTQVEQPVMSLALQPVSKDSGGQFSKALTCLSYYPNWVGC
jgi:hypothetical protein